MPKFTAGDRVTYYIYRTDEQLFGTVTATGYSMGGGSWVPWVEVQRDSHPDGPVARLSVLGCQVQPA